MILIVALLLVVAVLVWVGRGMPYLPRGRWRMGAGLVGVVGVAAGALIAVRGATAAGAGVVLISLGLLFAARTRQGRRSAAAGSGAGLSLQEARALLGVGEGASAGEVRAAYARLMARVHPDVGGTGGLAAQLNAARDRLLKR